jgi:phosphoketolase
MNFRTADYEKRAKHENEIKITNPELLHKIDDYWRAANYLPVGQIYL